MRQLFLFILISSLGDQYLFATSKRFGAVDLESNELTSAQKNQVLETIRSRIGQWRVWNVVSKDDIEEKLMQPNPYKQHLVEMRASSSSAREIFEANIESAISLYQQSQFLEALGVFENALLNAKSLSLDVSLDSVRRFFQFYSAASFFESRREEAVAIMSSLLWLDPAFKLDPDRFPPDLVSTLQSASGRDIDVKEWSFSSDQSDIEVRFFGFPLAVSGNGKLSVQLPVQSAYLSKISVVLTKSGFLPQIFSLDSLPEKIIWHSLTEKKRSTKGLFAPLGSLTANAELKSFISQLNLSVLFLGSVEKKKDRWLFQGQWYETQSHRASEVREVKATDLSLGVEALLEEMLNDIAPDGRIIDPRGVAGLEPSRIRGTTDPFYKTWWFWTLAGVGVVGAGVGTYFLLNSSDSLKLRVRAAE